jgi:hypothetical protein
MLRMVSGEGVVWVVLAGGGWRYKGVRRITQHRQQQHINTYD